MKIKLVRRYGFTDPYWDLFLRVGWRWRYVTGGRREDILNRIRDYLTPPTLLDTDKLTMKDVEGILPKEDVKRP